MTKKNRILTFLLIFLMAFAITAPIVATLTAQSTEAISISEKMLKQAKKTKTNTRYVIVTDFGSGNTKVYDTKDKYHVVASGKSCGAKKQKTGQFYLTGAKKMDRDGSPVNGKVVYHEFYVSVISRDGEGIGWENKMAIHTRLYKSGSQKALYNNTAKQIQDSSNPYGHNWSAGCTRTTDAVAKYIYNNCKKGTGYYIIG